MKILAIDISTNHFGYAIFDNKELMSYKHEKIHKLKAKSELAREEFIYNYFHKLTSEEKPDIIISEYFFLSANPKVFGKLQMLQGILMTLSFQIHCEYKIYDIKHYRKIMEVKGKRSEEIKLSCKEIVLSLYPDVEIDSEFDISDAIVMALAYQKEFL